MNPVSALRRKSPGPEAVHAPTLARFVSALDRIASATSVIRTREQDAERFIRNGDAGELLARVESEAVRLEQVAQRLETL